MPGASAAAPLVVSLPGPFYDFHNHGADVKVCYLHMLKPPVADGLLQSANMGASIADRPALLALYPPALVAASTFSLRTDANMSTDMYCTSAGINVHEGVLPIIP